jgi:hypothetical protein
VRYATRIFPITFLSILSIKRENWFYWAERAETADRAEIKESPLFMDIYSYVAKNQRLAQIRIVRIPLSPPGTVEIPKEMEARIVAEAQASGVPVSELVRDPLVSGWQRKDGSHDLAKERALAAGMRIRELRKGVTLGGLSIKDLINEERP